MLPPINTRSFECVEDLSIINEEVAGLKAKSGVGIRLREREDIGSPDRARLMIRRRLEG